MKHRVTDSAGICNEHEDLGVLANAPMNVCKKSLPRRFGSPSFGSQLVGFVLTISKNSELTLAMQVEK
jgi:hypothetical protein